MQADTMPIHITV